MHGGQNVERAMKSAQQNRGLHGTGFSRVLKRAARKLVDSLGQEHLLKNSVHLI
jgi:hypothetical protein